MNSNIKNEFFYTSLSTSNNTNTYDLARGIFNNSAYLDNITNFVANLGGVFDGGVKTSFTIEKGGYYILELQYLSSDENNSFKIEINGIEAGYYTPPITDSLDLTDAKVFTFIVKLKGGINEILFHGDGINEVPLLGTFSINDIPPFIITDVVFDYKELNSLNIDSLISLLKEINYRSILNLYELTPESINFFTNENRLNAIIDTLNESGNNFTVNNNMGIETLSEILRAGYYLAKNNSQLNIFKTATIKNKCILAIKSVQKNSNFNLTTTMQISVIKSIARLIEYSDIDIEIINNFVPVLRQFKAISKINPKEYKKRDVIYFIISNLEKILQKNLSDNNMKVKTSIYYKNIDNFITGLEDLAQESTNFPSYALDFVTSLIYYIGKFYKFRTNIKISQVTLTNCFNVYPYLSKPCIEALSSLKRYFNGKFSNGVDIEYDKKIEEAKIKYLPNTYKFDNDTIVMRVGSEVSEEQLKRFYWAAHEVKAQFFRITGQIFPLQFVSVDDVLTAIIYNSVQDFSLNFRLFGRYVKQSGGFYDESIGTFFTFNLTKSKNLFNVEYFFRHEYSHYLQEKYAVPGTLGGRTSSITNNNNLLWFREGSAQFFSGATRKEGIKASKAFIKPLTINTLKSIDKITRAGFGNFDFYEDAFAFIYYLYNNRRDIYDNLNNLIRNSDSKSYDTTILNLANNEDLNVDFKQKTDILIGSIDSLTIPSVSNEYFINHPNMDATKIKQDILSIIPLDDVVVETFKSQFFNTFFLVATYYTHTNLDYSEEWKNMNKLMDEVLSALENKGWSGYKTFTAYFSDYYVTDDGDTIFSVMFHGFLSN